MIVVPVDVWSQTLAILRECGAGRRECVAYWLTSAPGEEDVQRVVHPKHTATVGYYRVDDAWLTGFWIDLARSGEAVAVQVHTHGGRASHSPTDDEGAIVYQPGFRSLVLPGFALRDDCRDRAYLAELDHRGRWRRVPLTGIRWK